MKIPLDECVPVDFRHHLQGHEVHTVRWAGFNGLTDGELLNAAEAGAYDVMLTVDKGIPYQNRLAGRARSNRIQHLTPLFRLRVDNDRRALEAVDFAHTIHEMALGGEVGIVAAA